MNDDEAELKNHFIKKELVKVAKEYIKEKCNSKGEIIENNISKKQENTIKSLKKRTEVEGLSIYETDKTKKLVIDTLENVEAKMAKHVEKDMTISDKIVTKKENILNAHTSNWIDILNIGENVNHKARIKSNLVTVQNPLPVLHGTAKDHKPCDLEHIGPDMRPIMGAKIGPNTGLAEIGCKIIRSISEEVKTRFDVKSTEEMLSKISQYNKSVKSSKRRIIASMDIKNFYPSIDPERGSEIARIMWDRSDVEITDINVDQLAFYLGKFGDPVLLENLALKDVIYKKSPRKIRSKKISKKHNKFKDFKALRGVDTPSKSKKVRNEKSG